LPMIVKPRGAELVALAAGCGLISSAGLTLVEDSCLRSLHIEPFSNS
jgi:hypothetical protein